MSNNFSADTLKVMVEAARRDLEKAFASREEARQAKMTTSHWDSRVEQSKMVLNVTLKELEQQT